MVREIPYFDLPNDQAWCRIGISATEAPLHDAIAGMKRCSSP